MNRAELERITRIYSERQAHEVQARYAANNPAERFMQERREAAILALLRRHGMQDLSTRRILDVGCGRGQGLADWIRCGARGDHLAGVDVMQAFIHEAQAQLPGTALALAAGDQLPFAAHSFDIVCQFTLFTSILDSELRRQTAADMLRVLRRPGLLLWYDFRVDNPRNRHVRGIGRSELTRLFPDCRIDCRSVTLAPPIARALGHGVFAVGTALEALPFLRTHYLAAILC
jgi:SAM-dependent methyltransferase